MGDATEDARADKNYELKAHVAQLAEHVLGKDEVTRSIRVVGSIPYLTRLETFCWWAAEHLILVCRETVV